MALSALHRGGKGEPPNGMDFVDYHAASVDIMCACANRHRKPRSHARGLYHPPSYFLVCGRHNEHTRLIFWFLRIFLVLLSILFRLHLTLGHDRVFFTQYQHPLPIATYYFFALRLCPQISTVSSCIATYSLCGSNQSQDFTSRTH